MKALSAALATVAAIAAAVLLVALVAASALQTHAATAAAPAFTLTRCADFDHDGVVSLAEVDEEISYFGTYKGGPANGLLLFYDQRHDLRIELAPGAHPPLAEKFHIDIGDILVAVRQHQEGC